MNPSNEFDISLAAAAGAVTGASISIAEVDTSGYDYIALVGMTATVASAATVTTCQLTHSDTSGSGHVAATTNVTMAAGASNSNLKILLAMPVEKRYVDATITAAGGASFGHGTLYWMKMRGGSAPLRVESTYILKSIT